VLKHIQQKVPAIMDELGLTDRVLIELKCVAKLSDGYRFFLSDTEQHQTSLSVEHSDGYYFYLVFFDASRNPVEMLAIVADQLYPKAELLPSSYEVRFDRKEFEKSGKARVLPGKSQGVGVSFKRRGYRIS
jgi:hypothetical protein